MPATASYDVEISFYVSFCYGNSKGQCGILTASARQNAIGTLSNPSLIWNSGNDDHFKPEDFIIAYNSGDTTGATLELWLKSEYSYTLYHFDVIQQATRAGWDELWTLYDKPTAQASVTSGFTQKESVLSCNYIKSSGGTISSDSFGPLIIKRNNTNHAAIQFENSKGILGAISMNAVDGDLMKYNSTHTTNCTILDSGNFKTHVTPSEIGALDVDGNAKTATTATNSTNVYSTLTNPTTSSTYYVDFHTTASSANKSLRHNNGLVYTSLEGTADAEGSARLALGNNIAGGTAGNKTGRLRLFGKTTFYGDLILSTSDVLTANRTYGLPDATGIIALTSSNITGTSAGWTTPRNINGMHIDGKADRFNYGTCSTAAATAAKTVACGGFLAPVTGSEITVKFTTTNTAANPTLNVNNTGAKPIYYRGAAITAGYLAANRTYTFRYNGTQYELVGR
ncbi:MAG: hypothetical protein NC235_03995 [Clostridiales bacterium]|nr:hypothetical protein [Clostridiales bacterium]